MNMDVSVVIVNYNTKKLLLDCIRSIKDHVHKVSYEIIVVDNCSSDNSQEAVINAYPDVVFLESGENLGFGKANNLGAKHANGVYLFFLNSDTLLINDAVSLFYEYATSYNYQGALGAILEDEKECSIHSYNRFTSVSDEFRDCISKYIRFLKRKDLLHPTKVENPLSVDYVTGADLFMPANVFSDLNGFDPDYFMYSEECDLQYRMSLKGYPRTIIPGPRIIHLEGGSDPSKTKKWSYSRYYNMTNAKMLYVHKHLSPFSSFLFHTIDFIFLTPIVLVSKYSSYQKKSLIRLFLKG